MGMVLLIPLLAVGVGIGYLVGKSRPTISGVDALDYATADIIRRGRIGQIPATRARTTATTQLAPSPLSLSSASSTFAPDSTPTGQTVMTPPTASEPSSLVLPLVMPATQPKMPSASDLESARVIAPQLDEAMKTNRNGAAFDATLAALVVRFQGHTNITEDGRYGPSTAGALMCFLDGQPPPPPFVSSNASRVIKLYRPQGVN